MSRTFFPCLLGLVTLVGCSSTDPPVADAALHRELMSQCEPYSIEPAPDVTPVKVIRRVQPRHPRHGPESGFACIALTIDENGMVTETEIVAASDHAYARVFEDAVKQSVFEPATKDGVAIESRLMIPFSYTTTN